MTSESAITMARTSTHIDLAFARSARADGLGASFAAPPQGAPDDRATEFTAVDPSKETYSGNTLLVVAYAAIWIVLMGYILLLWRKQVRHSERLDDLERTIDRAAAAAEKKAKAKGA